MRDKSTIFLDATVLLDGELLSKFGESLIYAGVAATYGPREPPLEALQGHLRSAGHRKALELHQIWGGGTSLGKYFSKVA